jgi:predicted RNase H-like HicB family nuclease
MKIQYDFKDNIWYSYSDELPGCYGEGATKEEAKESFMKTYQMYREIAHSNGFKLENEIEK